jgi:hypothetical protein
LVTLHGVAPFFVIDSWCFLHGGPWIPFLPELEFGRPTLGRISEAPMVCGPGRFAFLSSINIPPTLHCFSPRLPFGGSEKLI